MNSNAVWEAFVKDELYVYPEKLTESERLMLFALRRHQDAGALAKLMAGILDRLHRARELHPRYAENVWHGWGFVGEEFGEANKELTKAKPGWLDRAEEEMADLVVVTLRMMLREYEHGEDA